MSPEPTGVHGLLKQRKLFTHKLYIQSPILLIQTFILPISKLTPYEIRNLSTTCGRLSQT